MNRKSLWIGSSILVLTIVSGLAVSEQDRYTLKLPGGVAFSDFKGYGDWQLISSAETDDRMKVILGNPTIIAAYKSGIPGNGKPFPDGSMNVEAGSGCPPPRFVASCGLSTTVLFLKWALTY